MTNTFYEGLAVWLLMVGLISACLFHHPLLMVAVAAPFVAVYSIRERLQIFKMRDYLNTIG